MATDVELVRKYALREAEYPAPENYNAKGSVKEPNCSDELTVYLRVNARQFIEAAGFELTPSACDTTRACAVKCCELAQKQPVLAAYMVNADAIAAALDEGGEPDREHVHCAQMAELALKRAVLDYSRSLKQ